MDVPTMSPMRVMYMCVFNYKFIYVYCRQFIRRESNSLRRISTIDTNDNAQPLVLADITYEDEANYADPCGSSSSKSLKLQTEAVEAGKYTRER